MLQQFVSDESGQSLVEYGLLISLLAVVVIAVLTSLGSRLQAGFSAAAANLSTTT